MEQSGQDLFQINYKFWQLVLMLFRCNCEKSFGPRKICNSGPEENSNIHNPSLYTQSVMVERMLIKFNNNQSYRSDG